MGKGQLTDVDSFYLILSLSRFYVIYCKSAISSCGACHDFGFFKTRANHRFSVLQIS